MTNELNSLIDNIYEKIVAGFVEGSEAKAVVDACAVEDISVKQLVELIRNENKFGIAVGLTIAEAIENEASDLTE